jgi:hypothetical protein
MISTGISGSRGRMPEARAETVNSEAARPIAACGLPRHLESVPGFRRVSDLYRGRTLGPRFVAMTSMPDRSRRNAGAVYVRTLGWTMIVVAIVLSVLVIAGFGDRGIMRNVRFWISIALALVTGRLLLLSAGKPSGTSRR